MVRERGVHQDDLKVERPKGTLTSHHIWWAQLVHWNAAATNLLACLGKNRWNIAKLMDPMWKNNVPHQTLARACTQFVYHWGGYSKPCPGKWVAIVWLWYIVVYCGYHFLLPQDCSIAHLPVTCFIQAAAALDKVWEAQRVATATGARHWWSCTWSVLKKPLQLSQLINWDHHCRWGWK